MKEFIFFSNRVEICNEINCCTEFSYLASELLEINLCNKQSFTQNF